MNRAGYNLSAREYNIAQRSADFDPRVMAASMFSNFYNITQSDLNQRVQQNATKHSPMLEGMATSGFNFKNPGHGLDFYQSNVNSFLNSDNPLMRGYAATNMLSTYNQADTREYFLDEESGKVTYADNPAMAVTQDGLAFLRPQDIGTYDYSFNQPWMWRKLAKNGLRCHSYSVI
jgi:hypothetical protein